MVYQEMDGRRVTLVAVASFVAAFLATVCVSKAVSGSATQHFVTTQTMTATRPLAAFNAAGPGQVAQPSAAAVYPLAASQQQDPGHDIEWVENDVQDVILPDSQHLEFGVFMATRIRLTRMGRKQRPFYRVVIQDSRAPRDGRFIEKVGWYDPLKKYEDPSRMNLDLERVLYWLGEGAQPTETVLDIINQLGLKMPPYLQKRYETITAGRKISWAKGVAAKEAAAAAAAAK